MARPIDEKIVKMTLDNSDFKSKVQETIASFASINKGIKTSGDSMNLSSIANGISQIESRFSTTGVVVGSVINNLVSSAMGLGGKLVHAVVDPLMEGGKKRALNIEQAKFQFEGLGMDVEATMASALAAVKGTAFGLDEAAVVASQFGATGMRAGDEMTAALRGISGVAAMTGSSYADIGTIFTTVAGNGRLMGSELLRLSSRGVNAAAVLAKSMGITEAEVRDMVTKGKISFEEFAGAMNDAFGEHATRANETYVGSLSNVKAALSRVGAAIKAPEFENKKMLFNALTPVIDNLAAAIQPLIDLWTKLGNISTRKLVEGIKSLNFDKFVELGGIGNLVQGFWNIALSGMTILRALGKAFSRLFPPTTAAGLVSITEAFKNLTSGLVFTEENGQKLIRIFEGVGSLFSSVWEIAKHLGNALLKLIPPGLGTNVMDILVSMADFAIGMNDSIKEGNLLTKAIDLLGTGLGKLGGWLRDGILGLINFASGIRTHMGTAIDWLTDKLSPVGAFLKETFSGFGMDEILGGGVLLGIGAVVKKVMGFLDSLKEATEGFGIFDSISGLLDGIGGALESFQEKVKHDNLLKIAISLGILAVALNILSHIKAVDISKGMVALAGSLGIMMAGMFAIEKLSLTGGILAAGSLILLSTAILIMASALKKLSDLNPGELSVGIVGLIAVTTALAAAVIAISKWGGKLGVSSLSLLALATAILILSSAVKKMAEIDAGDLFKSIGALILIFGSLAAFLKVVDGSKLTVGSAVGVLIVSGAIQVMVGAIQKIADIPVGDLVKGLVTLGLILAEIALFSAFGASPHMLLAGAGMLLMAGAIRALVGPIQALGEMSLAELGTGLGAIAIALGLVAGAAYLMSGAMLGAATLVVLAVGLGLLVGPIKILGSMPWQALLLGIGGLALGLGLLAGASILLTPAVLPMLAFGAALVVLGAGIALAGLGIGAFGAGMASLASLTAVSAAAIISALGILIRGLGGLITDIVKFISNLTLALVGGLLKIAPELADAALVMLVGFAKAFEKHLPTLLVLGVKMVTQIMDGINEHAPALATKGAQVIITLIDAMAGAIETQGPRFTAAFLNLLGQVLIVFVDAGVQVVIALFGWIPGVEQAATGVGIAMKMALENSFNGSDAGSKKGEEFAGGVSGTSGSAQSAGNTIGEAAKTGASSVDASSSGTNFGLGFANGISSSSVIAKVVSNAGSVARAALSAIKKTLEERSPSRATARSGVNAGLGLAKGIKSTEKKVAKAAKDSANTAKKNFKVGMDKTKFDFKMGKIDTAQHIKALESLKKAYSKQPELARQAEAEIKKIRDKSVKEDKDSARKKYDDQKEAIADRKYYDTMNLQQEIKAWRKLQNMYKKGSDERKELDKEVYRVSKEIKAQKYNDEKQLMADRKYYNTLNLDEELKALRVLQNKYKKGTDERKETDKAIYRVNQEIRNKIFEDEKKMIADRRFFNDWSMHQEMRGYEVLQRKYKKGSEERIEIDRELYRLKKDLEKKYIDDKKAYNMLSMQEELKMWQDIQEQYTKGSDSRVEADREVYRLKNEIHKALLNASDEYLAKVADANQRLIDGEKALNEEYRSALKSRGDAITNFVGLFDHVQTQGAAPGWVLLENLESQYNALHLWEDNLNALANRPISEKLLQKLREMGPKMAGEIGSLLELSEEEFRKYNELFEANDMMGQWMAQNELEGLKKDTEQKINELHTQTAVQLEEYKQEWLKKVNEIKSGVKGEFVDLNASMKTIGAQSVRGLMAGLQSMKGPLQAEAQSIANSISATIRKALDIRSPSKLLEKDGAFSGMGLAIGLRKQASNVKDAASTLADQAKEALLDFMDGYELDDEDSELHFKAVVDYDEIDPSKFGSIAPQRIDTTLTNQKAKSDLLDRQERQNENTSTTSDNSRKYEPHITVQSGPSGREIARETERTMRKLAFDMGV